MMAMQLSEAARVLSARQIGADVGFAGISTDSRTLTKGNLFVALTGPHFDGHDYVAQAAQHGAAAAAVTRELDAELPMIRVPDTRRALGQLAGHWRSQFAIPVVAVTGSNGKTTVKEMAAAILARRGPVLATHGNLNNDIGVPLTLAGLAPEHQAAVIEMGANHAGEIAYLAALAEPTVAVITNAAAAHLEGFGSLQGVAQAKGEIFSGLRQGGVAVVNADDAFADQWRKTAQPHRVIDFGLTASAQVRAAWQPEGVGARLDISFQGDTVALCLPLPGRHNVMNALAATAVAVALGMNLGEVAAVLASMAGVRGRLQVRERRDGLRVIDDTYNANPASLHAALEVVAAMPGECWLVLGDMAELGDEAESWHREAAQAARLAGVSRLYGLGELATLAAHAFGARGSAFATREQLETVLAEAAGPGVTLLVKGSRRMGMEHVVQALLDDANAVAGPREDCHTC